MDELERLDQLEQLYFQSDELQIKLRLKTLWHSYWIFHRNYVELQKYLEEIQKLPTFFQWISVDAYIERDQVLLELTRMLHNFLSSAMMLVDHTRALVKLWYDQHIFFQQYDSEIKNRFRKSDLHRFIQCLRNYTLHYLLPLPHVNLSFSRNSLSEEFVNHSAIVLSRKQLLQWKGWDQKARSYLQSNDGDIVLGDLLNEYFKIVHDFHSWMHKQLQEIHEDELMKLKEMANEIKEFRKRANLE